MPRRTEREREGMAGGAIASSGRALRTALRNPSLRRVLLAFLLFNTQEYAVWVAVAVYAFQQGGAAETGLVLVAQLIPSAFVAPVGAVLGDRMSRDAALRLGYGIQTVANLALGLALLAAPPLVAYAAAVIASCAITLTRPVHNSILPRLASTPAELTAANAASSTMDGLGTLIGPLLGAPLMLLGGPGGSVLVMASLSAAAVTLTTKLGLTRIEDPAEERAETAGGFVQEALGGIREARREADAAVLLALGGAQFVMVGMLDVFFALLAIDVLGMGESGAGILAAGFGLGLLVGAAAAVTLAAARRLAPAVFAALAGSGAALAALALAGMPITAVMVLAACGASIGVFAVASRTLLQRTVDDDVLARVFGLEEALQMLGLAIGSAAAPILISMFGDAGALAAAGIFLALVALLAWPRLRRIDRVAHIAPAEWIWLLRSIPIFAPLPQARLERLASHAIALQVSAGTVLIREGDEGDRFYTIVEGTVDVTSGGRAVATHTSGGYVGEIALLRDVRRTATVTARTDLSLLALERADFLAAVTGSRVGRMRAHQEADRRIADLGDGSSEG